MATNAYVRIYVFVKFGVIDDFNLFYFFSGYQIFYPKWQK